MKILSLQAVLGAGAEEFKRISDQEMQVFLSLLTKLASATQSVSFLDHNTAEHSFLDSVCS